MISLYFNLNHLIDAFCVILWRLLGLLRFFSLCFLCCSSQMFFYKLSVWFVCFFKEDDERRRNKASKLIIKLKQDSNINFVVCLKQGIVVFFLFCCFASCFFLIASHFQISNIYFFFINFKWKLNLVFTLTLLSSQI